MSSSDDSLGSTFCSNPFHYNALYYVANGDGVGPLSVVTGCGYILMGLITIYWIKLQEANAKRDDKNMGAVKSLIFPVYVQLLWANTIINIYDGIVYLTLSYSPIENYGQVTSIIFSSMWALEHMVVEGVAFMLMRKGLGWNAAQEVIIRVIPWGIIVFICKYVGYTIYTLSPKLSLLTELLWQTILLKFYFCLWVLPWKKFFRRPAAIFYGQFWFFFRIISIISFILFYQDKVSFATGKCMYAFGNVCVYFLFEPFLVYYTLLQDSRWWQGLGNSNKASGNQPNAEIVSPLSGADLNVKSAQFLAETVDFMVKDEVKLLNFAYIHLQRNKPLGSGSFSKVYRGTYRDKECAIKLVFTLDITEDTINRIAAEVNILSQIKHPNVVHIFGVSVLPPSVCIVLELCQYGSLADVIKGNAVDSKPSVQAKAVLSLFDRYFLAVGCLRGLKALHDHDAELCHRDIKSFNFLVDGQLNAKIADLELGVTKSERIKEIPAVINLASPISPTTDDLNNCKIGEDSLLANWAAPEFISSGVYTQASDIYSMSLVLWEMLTGCVPFSDTWRQRDIQQRILSGERPKFPSICMNSNSPYYPLVQIISQGWDENPSNRPEASELLLSVEKIWKDIRRGRIQVIEELPDISLYLKDIAPIEEFSIFTALRSISTSPMPPSRTLSNASPKLPRSISLVPGRNQTTTPSSIQSLAKLLRSRNNKRNETQESRRQEFIQDIILEFQKDPGILRLENTQEAWLVISASFPYVIMFASSYWYVLLGISIGSQESNNLVVGKTILEVLYMNNPTDITNAELEALEGFLSDMLHHGQHEAHLVMDIFQDSKNSSKCSIYAHPIAYASDPEQCQLFAIQFSELKVNDEISEVKSKKLGSGRLIDSLISMFTPTKSESIDFTSQDIEAATPSSNDVEDNNYLSMTKSAISSPIQTHQQVELTILSTPTSKQLDSPKEQSFALDLDEAVDNSSQDDGVVL